MIQKLPKRFPQRKYGYCAGMPLDDEEGADASVAVAADTPYAHERPAESMANDPMDSDGNSHNFSIDSDDECISIVSDAEANNAADNDLGRNTATTSQLSRLHVPRTRLSKVVQPLPVDDSLERVQLHTGATSSTQLPGMMSDSVQGSRLSSASSRRFSAPGSPHHLRPRAVCPQSSTLLPTARVIILP
jgi:hypothetical protein